jgi:hypothetical protein
LRFGWPRTVRPGGEALAVPCQRGVHAQPRIFVCPAAAAGAGQPAPRYVGGTCELRGFTASLAYRRPIEYRAAANPTTANFTGRGEQDLMLGISRKFLLTACSIVAVILSSATAATAGTSNADGGFGAAAWSDCPAGHSCMWANTNGGGTLWVPASCGTYLQSDLPAAFNNNVESIKNQGGGTIRLFDNGSATGTALATYYNNGVNHNLTTANRNRTSSFRIDC